MMDWTDRHCRYLHRLMTRNALLYTEMIAAAALVRGGAAAAGFTLYPTAIDDLMAVADSGQVMPPKSTWFEPKLMDGLVSLPLD